MKKGCVGVLSHNYGGLKKGWLLEGAPNAKFSTSIWGLNNANNDIYYIYSPES